MDTTLRSQNLSVYHWLRNRQIGALTCFNSMDIFKGSKYLTRRLSNSATLAGHSGCVNTVSWNEDGTHLLSGSDDCHLNVYDANRRKLLLSVHSSHRSNIFSAKFLPSTCDYKCVSCAGLGSVEFSELTPPGDYLPHVFSCQTSITYQVATTPFDPNEFLTCEERGYVRLFDLRVKSSCLCDGCDKDVLYSFPCGVTSMSVHPLSPNYMALALGDGSTCLMDRRVTGFNEISSSSLTPAQLISKACLYTFKPDTMPVKPYKITNVQFNETGTELLVNYSEDYLYLFSSSLLGCGGSGPQSYCSERKYGEKRKSQHKVSSAHLSSQTTSNFTPPTKRLRLRGDWSDTGPDARPGDNNTSENGQGSFMNRMSHLFARWIDESYTTTEHNNQEPPASPVASSEDSFHIFTDSEDSSNPRTPTSSLTTAMASCSTESPQKVPVFHNPSLECNSSSSLHPNTVDSSEGVLQTTSNNFHSYSSRVVPSVTTNHRSLLHVVEGESDSDDIHDNSSVEDEQEKKDIFVKSVTHPLMIYQGHRNSRTMIKQASFWGNDFIISGSDCGRIFVWDKWTGEVVNALVGDSHVVNCVQPHPYTCVLATSGIDYDIKLWEPVSEQPCDLTDLESITQRNEAMLQESRNTITVPSSFILHVLAYLNRRRRMSGQHNTTDDEESS